MELLKQILDDNKLAIAYKQVYKNTEINGINGKTIDKLEVYMIEHKEEIIEQIREIKYLGYGFYKDK